jgi:hypothetical protein
VTDRPGRPTAHPDAARLLLPDPVLGVPVPSYGGRSLPNVARTVAEAVGHAVDGPLPRLDTDLDPFEGRRADGTVVLVVVDGLGWGALARSAELDPDGAAAHWSTEARPVSTVFPSSTTVALTSLSTAAAPGQHGVVGHREYLPQFGSVVELLRMSPLGAATENSLVGPAWTPEMVLGVRTIFRRGVPAIALSRDRFEGSGFTRMIYDGATYAPYSTFSGLGHELRRLLEREPPVPFVIVYWDELDMALHRHGPDVGLTAFEVDRLHHLLRWVARGLPPGRARSVRVVLTADHGLVAADPLAQLRVDAQRAVLDRLARPPAGDRRAAFLVPRPGATSDVRHEVERLLAGRGRVLDAAAAIERGLFGPPPHHPELRERVGELLVLPEPPGGVLYYLPGAPPPRSLSVAAHGGLDADELLVPLLARSLVRFAEEPPRLAREASSPPPEKR